MKLDQLSSLLSNTKIALTGQMEKQEKRSKRSMTT
jgi:hypothetical protein